MTIIRLIPNNYLQTLCSLSSSCRETELNIALQNPLPSPTIIPLLSISLSLYPSFFLLFLHPYPCCSVSIMISLLRPALLSRLLILFSHPSIIYPWVVITVIFLPSTHFPAKTQHPVYLCSGHAALHLPPLSGLSLAERLTIPSASLLIYHPNGGYKKEKTTICRGRNSHRRARKVFGLPLSIKFQPVNGFYLRGAGGAGPDQILTAEMSSADVHIHPQTVRHTSIQMTFVLVLKLRACFLQNTKLLLNKNTCWHEDDEVYCQLMLTSVALCILVSLL